MRVIVYLSDSPLKKISKLFIIKPLLVWHIQRVQPSLAQACVFLSASAGKESCLPLVEGSRQHFGSEEEGALNSIP